VSHSLEILSVLISEDQLKCNDNRLSHRGLPFWLRKLTFEDCVTYLVTEIVNHSSIPRMLGLDQLVVLVSAIQA
jgi:hypothetical protein